MRRRPAALALCAVVAAVASCPGGGVDAAAAATDTVATDGPAVVRARAAAMVLSGQSGGDLGMNVLALPLPADGGAPERVGVVVEADGSGLVQALVGGVVAVELFAYALDSDDAVIDLEARSFTLDPGLHRAAFEGEGLKAFAVLDAPPRGTTVRVLLRTAAGPFAIASATPGTAPDPGALPLPPLVLEPEADWAVSSEPAPRRVQPPTHPVLEAIVELTPPCRPLLVPGEPVELVVLTTGGDGGVVVDGLTATLRSADGATTSVGVEARPGPVAAAGWRSIAARLVPPEIPPGAYELSVTAMDDSGARVESPALEVSIPPPAAGPAVAGEALELPDEAPRRIGRSRGRQLERSYLDVVAELAAGRRDQALETLLRLEAANQPRTDPLALERIELGALDELGPEVWGALLPLALLHVDTSRAYAAADLFTLEHHGRRMAIRIAERRAELLDDPAAAAVGARLLEALALEALDDGTVSLADELLRRSRALGGEPSSLLVLAAIAEKRGRYQEAVALLAELVEWGASMPGAPMSEARLRLAINLARTGRGAAAVEALEALLTADPPDWVALLAHQQLARWDLDRDRPSSAAHRLAQALQRWPDNPRLAVQLSIALERMGERQRSQEAAMTATEVERSGESERFRYLRWPEVGGARQRLEALEAAAAEQLDRLGELLGKGR